MTPYYYSNEKRYYNFREIINDSAVRFAKKTAFQVKTKNGESLVKARVFPNLEYIKEKLGKHPSSDETETIIKKAIKAVNKKIPAYKHIKIVEVLSTALEKTTTQKIKRFGKNVK